MASARSWARMSWRAWTKTKQTGRDAESKTQVASGEDEHDDEWKPSLHQLANNRMIKWLFSLGPAFRPSPAGSAGSWLPLAVVVSHTESCAWLSAASGTHSLFGFSALFAAGKSATAKDNYLILINKLIFSFYTVKWKHYQSSQWEPLIICIVWTIVSVCPKVHLFNFQYHKRGKLWLCKWMFCWSTNMLKALKTYLHSLLLIERCDRTSTPHFLPNLKKFWLSWLIFVFMFFPCALVVEWVGILWKVMSHISLYQSGFSNTCCFYLYNATWIQCIRGIDPNCFCCVSNKTPTPEYWMLHTNFILFSIFHQILCTRSLRLYTSSL